MPENADELLPTRGSLLSRLKNADDGQGWQEFFDTYWRLIYGVARKSGLSEAEAEDAVQETIIAVSKHIAEFKYDPAKCSFKTWLLLLTRQRIARQFARRDPTRHSALSAGGSAARHADATGTATIDRIADPAGLGLEAVWNEEWEKNVLRTASERVKRQVKAGQYQMFDLYVLQGWPVRDVARTLRVSVAQVYLARHRVGRLLKKQLRQLQQELK